VTTVVDRGAGVAPKRQIGSGKSVATSTLRMWAYCALLTALAFVQDPGRIVADTKWDLAADPSGFLSRALHMWDPIGAFGQVQNQAYGYFWPMGPFFAAGEAVGLPTWVVQRLWWALILCVGFVGVVRLCRSLGLGVPWAWVVAGFSFTLSVHTLTLLGPTSIEAWPSAVAPWVLLAVIWGTKTGVSPLRAGAVGGLAVAMCGGVNAAATVAVLPLGVLWILTRSGGVRRWMVLGWWALFTVLATLWWLVPLLLLGKYAPPFLDYIENAPITSRTTGLADVVGGSSDWVAYASLTDWRAGHLLGTTPFLIVDATAIAALGLAGICRRDNPHARFLLGGVLIGLVLVGFGYTGDLHGWWAQSRQESLDGALAPLRNLHKFDVVLRLPLALGLAHFLSTLRARPRLMSDRVVRIAGIGAAAVAILGVASPAISGRIAPTGSFTEAPSYWYDAADYLAAHDDARALELPASSFGNYSWGATHDDVLQPLAQSAWAVRNVVPLAQPGNVRMLDTVTAVVEAGKPNDRLGSYLAANGVGYLVVRNDLDLFRTGAPDPVVLHQVLDRSAGLTKVAEFGPVVGGEAVTVDADGTKQLANRGRQDGYAAVEIYRVERSAPQVVAYPASDVPVVYGDPGSSLALTRSGTGAPPTVLAGDAPPELSDNPRVVTDGLRRRESAFAFVRYNQSATLTADDHYTTTSVEPDYRLYDDQAPYETVAGWQGVANVTASSSQADADAVGTINPAALPAAAVDGDARTQWQSTGFDGAVGQWWRVDLAAPTAVETVDITMGTAVGIEISQLELHTSAGKVIVDAPKPGATREFKLPDGSTDYLTITATRVRTGGRGVQMTLAEVALPGVVADRVLMTPDEALDVAPEVIALSRDPSRPACVLTSDAFSCDDVWVRQVEDLSSLKRVVRSPLDAAYRPSLAASMIPGRVTSHAVAAQLPVVARVSSALSKNLKAAAPATVDRDLRTTWTANVRQRHPRLSLRWDGRRRVSAIQVQVPDSAAASRPTDVVVVAGDTRQRVSLDGAGRATFDPVSTDRIRVVLVKWERAFSLEAGSRVALPPGVSEIRLPGSGVSFGRGGRATVDLDCGAGPTMSVNGIVTSTRIEATLADLMSDGPVPVEPCSDSPVALRAGNNVVLVVPSFVARPEQLILTEVDATVVAPSQIATSVVTWGSNHREVSIGPRSEESLLVVAENDNTGWVAALDGERLDSVRVDGWKQGWLVPAGAEATIVLSYQPDGVYRLALGLGLVVVVMVVAGLVVWRRSGSELEASTASDGHFWVDALLVCGLLGLMCGWVGLALAILALAAAAVIPRLPDDAGLLAAGLVASGGLVQALGRTETDVSTSWASQLLIAGGLAVAAAVVPANGPAFFRRRKGRSSP
jgi:arabinofuranan 3-O-arabinosyltransferase